jgi:hypothetical protein
MRTTSKLRPGEPVLVRCRPTKVIAVDGGGAPESSAFQDAVKALYGVAYTTKMARRRAHRPDFKVGGLEGIWSAMGAGADAWNAPRDQWRWKVLIPMPSDVTAAEVKAARAALVAKRGPGAASKVALETLREGTAVEALHVGPYASEPLTVQAMRAFMAEHALRARGQHHEIYLGDPRRTAPARLKTILRQPVAPSS